MTNEKTALHTVHIPVMGTAFTIDTPIKVGKYGISSVISLCDDDLCEKMRQYHCTATNRQYTPILSSEEDHRAKRFTAYLNLIQDILDNQWKDLIQSPFTPNSEITKYMELLPHTSPIKKEYIHMLTMTDETEKKQSQEAIRQKIKPAQIETNIMTKLDKDNPNQTGSLSPKEYSDALSACRGFAKSKLHGQIVFSAGFNRRLYSYCSEFEDFYPDKDGDIKKKIVLKVSDFRSSQIQGTFLAKKGLWVSEHRIESGLNCGGHAFGQNGHLIGPILEQFKTEKDQLVDTLKTLCNNTLKKNQQPELPDSTTTRITYQGGLGTHDEDTFIRRYYQLDGTGWGSPFLLVPEATILDPETRKLLINAKENDFYLSPISPLGVPFNTVKNTASEQQRMERVDLGRPGSPCPKGYLQANTEFTKAPICTASILYQKRKLAQSPDQKEAIIQKTCLCEDLAAAALITHEIDTKHPQKTVVCPGPNLAYFTSRVTLKAMVDHIYGKTSLPINNHRPHCFIKECECNINLLNEQIADTPVNKDTIATHQTTIQNIQDGLEYYKTLLEKIPFNTTAEKVTFNTQLRNHEATLSQLKQQVQKHSTYEPVTQ